MLIEMVFYFSQRKTIRILMDGSYNHLWFMPHSFEAVIFNKPSFAAMAIVFLFFA
jgi:hypothetical protein